MTSKVLHIMGGLLLGISQGLPADLISRVTGSGTSAAGNSMSAALSADGDHVVFVSHAPNLVTNRGRSPHLDLFVRDLVGQATILVSANVSGTGGGNASSHSPAISSNGQFIAFASDAGNLVADDTNGVADVFLRDMELGTTRLVTRDPAGTLSANPSPYSNVPFSRNPKISADGRYVFFESVGSLSVLPDANGASDIYVYDKDNETTSLVSVNSTGDGAGNGESDAYDISADGRFAVFVSRATDLGGTLANTNGDIYLRDMQSASTVWASSMLPGAFGGSGDNYRCFKPKLSAAGRHVVFLAAPRDFTNPVLVVHFSANDGQQTIVNTNGHFHSQPIISADGQRIAYESGGSLYVWLAESKSNVLVSARSDNSGPSTRRAHSPFATPDFAKVGFISDGTDLVAGITTAVSRVYVRDLGSNVTLLASVSSDGQPNRISIEGKTPAILPQGDSILFEALDAGLTPADYNESYDVFLRRPAANETMLISRRAEERPSATSGMTGLLAPQSLTSNGMRITFSSLDRPDVPRDTNLWEDVFVRDLGTGTVTAVTGTNTGFSAPLFSRDATISGDGRRLAYTRARPYFSVYGGQMDVIYADLETGSNRVVGGTGGAFPVFDLRPRISASGRTILFQSQVDAVNYGDPSGPNVYLHDIESGTNQLVSMRSSNMGSHPGPSTNALLSPNEAWVLFTSADRTLTPDQPSTPVNLYARNLQTYITVLISKSQSDARARGVSSSYSFSGDSRYVAYASANRHLCLYDLLNASVRVVLSNALNPVLSGDGKFAVYEAPLGPGGIRNLMLVDFQAGVTNLITRGADGALGNGHSSRAQISRDGRYVVFASRASNLVPDDSNGVSDIFVRDRYEGRTFLVSNGGGDSGAGPSSNPVMAADGRTVAFESMAPDLVSGDYNEKRDIFVLRLGTEDSDGDAIDDDWELTYFSNLDRDGSGDYDQDGQTDLQEFIAGTDPTNTGSLLRVITLSGGNGGSVVFWSATPGKTYRLQYKADLTTAGWADVPGDVVAQGDMASKSHGSVGSLGFYRVVLLQ